MKNIIKMMNHDIWRYNFIKFPFTDLSQSKLKPALVLAEPDLRQDLVICAISSQLNKSVIVLEGKDLLEGSLPVKSYICYQKIITISRNIVVKKVAKLKSVQLQKVKKLVVSFFEE